MRHTISYDHVIHDLLFSEPDRVSILLLPARKPAVLYIPSAINPAPSRDGLDPRFPGLPKSMQLQLPVASMPFTISPSLSLDLQSSNSPRTWRVRHAVINYPIPVLQRSRIEIGSPSSPSGGRDCTGLKLAAQEIPRTGRASPMVPRTGRTESDYSPSSDSRDSGKLLCIPQISIREVHT